jgi:hypothetical protein
MSKRDAVLHLGSMLAATPDSRLPCHVHAQLMAACMQTVAAAARVRHTSPPPAGWLVHVSLPLLISLVAAPQQLGPHVRGGACGGLRGGQRAAAAQAMSTKRHAS